MTRLIESIVKVIILLCVICTAVALYLFLDVNLLFDPDYVILGMCVSSTIAVIGIVFLINRRLYQRAPCESKKIDMQAFDKIL
jgi:hypothetical protein